MMPMDSIKAQKKGWNCFWMGRWVGIRYYKRIVPVRQDLIFDFLFWKFVKPLNRTDPQFTNITNGEMRNNTKLKRLLECCEITLSMDEAGEICMVVVRNDDPQEVSFIVRNTSITNLLNEALKLSKIDE